MFLVIRRLEGAVEASSPLFCLLFVVTCCSHLSSRATEELVVAKSDELEAKELA